MTTKHKRRRRKGDEDDEDKEEQEKQDARASTKDKEIFEQKQQSKARTERDGDRKKMEPAPGMQPIAPACSAPSETHPLDWQLVCSGLGRPGSCRLHTLVAAIMDLGS